MSIIEKIFGRPKPREYTYRINHYDLLNDLGIKGRVTYIKYEIEKKELVIKVVD